MFAEVAPQQIQGYVARVILGDLSAISTVVTVPAGLLPDKVNIIGVLTLAPWCIYSPNRAGI